MEAMVKTMVAMAMMIPMEMAMMMLMMMTMTIAMTAIAMKKLPGYTRERTNKKTDRAGDPTHYEGGGDDTAEKYASNDFGMGRRRRRKNREARLGT